MPITLSEAKLASKQFKNSKLSINCRSFNKNKSDIIDLAHELSPCIINLSEIFNPYAFCLKGFKGLTRTRPNRMGGGVGLLIRQDICL